MDNLLGDILGYMYVRLYKRWLVVKLDHLIVDNSNRGFAKSP